MTTGLHDEMIKVLQNCMTLSSWFCHENGLQINSYNIPIERRHNLSHGCQLTIVCEVIKRITSSACVHHNIRISCQCYLNNTSTGAPQAQLGSFLQVLHTSCTSKLHFGLKYSTSPTHRSSMVCLCYDVVHVRRTNCCAIWRLLYAVCTSCLDTNIES